MKYMLNRVSNRKIYFENLLYNKYNGKLGVSIVNKGGRFINFCRVIQTVFSADSAG
jgi:hypothetical protein